MLVVCGFFAFRWALPFIVRRQLSDVLTLAGYEQHSFRVVSASLWGARIEDLRAGPHDEIKITSADVGFEPLNVLRGRIEAIAIKDASFNVDLDAIERLRSTKPTTLADKLTDG